MSDNTLKVAVLGLGIMGSGIAANILSNGFPLTVYNRTGGKADPLVAQGARAAASPRVAADGADIVIAVVGDDAASREVWLGDDGALAGTKRGAVLIECSTLTPDWIRELAALVDNQGAALLDAPLFGSKEAAISGKVRLVIGGSKEAFSAAAPVLEAFTSTVVHIGGTGTGSTWKLLNNMMGAVSAAVMAEAIVMAEKAGLDMEAVAALIPTSAGASPVVQSKAPRALARRYNDPDFALKWMRKDVSYALALADQLGVSAQQAAAALTLLDAARDKGYGDNDFAAVVEGLRD